MTKGWLQGSVERNRDHYPVGVSIRPEGASGGWAIENGIVAEIHVTRSDGDFQTISLSEKELGEVVHTFLMITNNAETRKHAAQFALNSLSDSDLLSFFARYFADRVESD